MGLVAATCALAPRDARADVSSWLAIGGGYALQKSDTTDQVARATALSISLGVGSSPRGSVVVGGLARSVTYFSLGTDLSLGPRIATGGFARGDWGVAFDASVVARLWNRGEYGRFPVQPTITLGAPWGFQLAVGAQVFDLDTRREALGGFAVLELDLLRFTVMRRGSTDSVWFNPSPAGGR